MKRLRTSVTVVCALVPWLASGSPQAQTSVAWWVVPGLKSRSDVAELLDGPHQDCRLPFAGELLHWNDAASAGAASPENGLYWVQPASEQEEKYGLYLHLPTRQIVEYGSLMFDAHLVLVCHRPTTTSD